MGGDSGLQQEHLWTSHPYSEEHSAGCSVIPDPVYGHLSGHELGDPHRIFGCKKNLVEIVHPSSMEEVCPVQPSNWFRLAVERDALHSWKIIGGYPCTLSRICTSSETLPTQEISCSTCCPSSELLAPKHPDTGAALSHRPSPRWTIDSPPKCLWETTSFNCNIVYNYVI